MRSEELDALVAAQLPGEVHEPAAAAAGDGRVRDDERVASGAKPSAGSKIFVSVRGAITAERSIGEPVPPAPRARRRA